MKDLIITETTPSNGEVSFYEANFYGERENKSVEIRYSDIGGAWTFPGEMCASLTTNGDEVMLIITSSQDSEVIMKLDFAEIELVGMLYDIYNRILKRPADRVKFDLFTKFEED